MYGLADVFVYAHRNPHSSSVLPFVTKILQNKTISKDYDDLGSYGGPMTTAYPWATAIPTGV